MRNSELDVKVFLLYFNQKQKRWSKAILYFEQKLIDNKRSNSSMSGMQLHECLHARLVLSRYWSGKWYLAIIIGFTSLKIDLGSHFVFMYLGFLGVNFKNTLERPNVLLDKGILFKVSPIKPWTYTCDMHN